MPPAGPQLHLVSRSSTARERAARQDPPGMSHGNALGCNAGIERCCFFGKGFLVTWCNYKSFFDSFAGGG